MSRNNIYDLTAEEFQMNYPYWKEERPEGMSEEVYKSLIAATTNMDSVSSLGNQTMREFIRASRAANANQSRAEQLQQAGAVSSEYLAQVAAEEERQRQLREQRRNPITTTGRQTREDQMPWTGKVGDFKALRDRMSIAMKVKDSEQRSVAIAEAYTGVLVEKKPYRTDAAFLSRVTGGNVDFSAAFDVIAKIPASVLCICTATATVSDKTLTDPGTWAKFQRFNVRIDGTVRQVYLVDAARQLAENADWLRSFRAVGMALSIFTMKIKGHYLNRDGSIMPVSGGRISREALDAMNAHINGMTAGGAYAKSKWARLLKWLEADASRVSILYNSVLAQFPDAEFV